MGSSVEQLAPGRRASWGVVSALVTAGSFLVVGAVVRWPELDQLENVVVLLVFSAAIALAALRPWVSLALLVVVPAAQLLQSRQAPDIVEWTLYGAALLVAPFAGSSLAGVRRYAGLLVGAVVCFLDAVVIVRDGGWGRWTLPNGQPFQSHPLWWEFGTIFLGGFGLYAGAWAVGVVLSSLRLLHRLQAAEERLEDRELALRLSEDRARIARDVHDALAHSLAVVVSQAEGASALQQLRPETTDASLRNIASVARSALTDVRRLVEQIREDDDVVAPRSSTDDVDALVDQMRLVGMTIAVERSGIPGRLTPSQDVAVYHIVQEALTNALKHGGTSSTATVGLHWTADGLTLEVASVGDRPLITPGSSGRGVGLEGMRERARIAGGWATAGRSVDGRFVVDAAFPSADDQHETADARSTGGVA